MTEGLTPLANATLHQRQAIEAYMEAGTIKAAAESLGVPEQNVKNRLTRLYRQTGIKNIAEAAYWLGWERARRLA